jgi:hypothetical protein
MIQKKLNSDSPNFRGVLALASKLSTAASTAAKANSNRYHILNMKIFLIVENIDNRPAIESLIQKAVSSPPLSKFGINAHIILLTLQEIQDLQPSFGIPRKEKLWLYRRGITHKFQAETTMQKWLEDILVRKNPSGGARGCPTIAINVAVSQKIARTWRPKNDSLTV